MTLVRAVPLTDPINDYWGGADTTPFGDLVLADDIGDYGGEPGTLVGEMVLDDEIESYAPASGPAAFIAAVLADSPEGFWELQEASGLPQDSSGNGNHMTSVDGTPDYHETGPMTSDFAIKYGGAENHQRATITAVADNFTAELFLSPEVVGLDNQGVIYNGDGGGNGWGLLIHTNGKISFLAGGVAIGGASDVALDVTSGPFYLLHLVRRAGAWEYWINGVKDTASIGTTAPNAPSGGVTLVGNTSAVQGRWAYAAIYETALSQARIEAHYAASGL